MENTAAPTTRRALTPKQTLLAHLDEFHSKQNVGLRRWSSRSTLAELQRAHGYAHHHYGGSTSSHRHGRPDEPLNRGPESRPEGWRTGLDVILQNRENRVDRVFREDAAEKAAYYSEIADRA